MICTNCSTRARPRALHSHGMHLSLLFSTVPDTMLYKFVCLLATVACVEARWRCTFAWRVADPSCTRMKAEAVRLKSTFGECFSGSRAEFTGYGILQFPSNETLTAGDWQYRIFEDGVKNKVASDAGDIMKSIHIDGNRWSLAIPFVMPPKQATGHYVVDFSAKDQDKVEDMCLSLRFNYTRFESDE